MIAVPDNRDKTQSAQSKKTQGRPAGIRKPGELSASRSKAKAYGADDFDMLVSSDGDDFSSEYKTQSVPKPPKPANASKATKPSAGSKTETERRRAVSMKETKGIRRPAAEAKKAEEKHAKKVENAAKKEKSYRNMKHSRFSRSGSVAVLFLFIIVLIAIGVFSSFLSYTYLVDKYENPITVESVYIEEDTRTAFKIEKGQRTDSIAEELKDMGLIKNKFLFKLLSKFNGYDSLYKSGVHYLCKGLTYDEIMVLLSAEPETVTVMFPEGFTTVQIAERLEANNVVSKAEFLDAVNNLDLSSYSFVPQEKGDKDYRLDGFLFPDTYKFEIDSNPDTIIYKMLNRFSDVFKPEYYERAEKMGLDVLDVITIASYVEDECRINSERETIARVYYNRLISDSFTYLECDATVKYLVEKTEGKAPERITAEMLEIDDKYNTYKYGGLTPGPICSPSEASIKAVIEMNPHDYYYYVLKKDGGGVHVFSKTLEEHKAAVKENSAE